MTNKKTSARFNSKLPGETNTGTNDLHLEYSKGYHKGTAKV